MENKYILLLNNHHELSLKEEDKAILTAFSDYDITAIIINYNHINSFNQLTPTIARNYNHNILLGILIINHPPNNTFKPFLELVGDQKLTNIIKVYFQKSIKVIQKVYYDPSEAPQKSVPYTFEGIEQLLNNSEN